MAKDDWLNNLPALPGTYRALLKLGISIAERETLSATEKDLMHSLGLHLHHTGADESQPIDIFGSNLSGQLRIEPEILMKQLIILTLKGYFLLVPRYSALGASYILFFNNRHEMNESAPMLIEEAYRDNLTALQNTVNEVFTQIMPVENLRFRLDGKVPEYDIFYPAFIRECTTASENAGNAPLRIATHSGKEYILPGESDIIYDIIISHYNKIQSEYSKNKILKNIPHLGQGFRINNIIMPEGFAPGTKTNLFSNRQWFERSLAVFELINEKEHRFGQQLKTIRFLTDIVLESAQEPGINEITGFLTEYGTYATHMEIAESLGLKQRSPREMNSILTALKPHVTLIRFSTKELKQCIFLAHRQIFLKDMRELHSACQKKAYLEFKEKNPVFTARLTDIMIYLNLVNKEEERSRLDHLRNLGLFENNETDLHQMIILCRTFLRESELAERHSGEKGFFTALILFFERLFYRDFFETNADNYILVSDRSQPEKNPKTAEQETS